MRSLLLLAAVCCLVLSAYAVPITQEDSEKEVSRQTAAAPAPAAAATGDDDDDEDDDDDDLDAIAGGDDDDDDDDDDAEADDDDDEDDDYLERFFDDILGGALTDEPETKQAPVPAVYITKYNKFVDNILEKMNEILRRSYDPVSVKLQPIDASKKKSKPKKSKTKPKTKTSNKKKNAARGTVPEVKNEDKLQEHKEEHKPEEIAPAKENLNMNENEQNLSESRSLKQNTRTERAKAKATTVKPKAKPKPPKTTKPKPTTKSPLKTTTKKPAKKNKVKSGERNKPRAKGTLYGLSSLRRTGDVAVSIMSDHTTVKSNFQVGPLILRVEKEVGRGAKKELKSATATTAEMSGKITLRVNNEGVATLHSIKVLQPKQVRVDSNHERTRELVWQRSSRIAHVVSEKLKSASKPMFQRQSVVRQ